MMRLSLPLLFVAGSLLGGCAQDPHSIAERQRMWQSIGAGANNYSQQRAAQPIYQAPVYQMPIQQRQQPAAPVSCMTRRVGNTAYTDCY